MQVLLSIAVALTLMVPVPSYAAPPEDESMFEALETALLAEMNLLRRDPRAYAAKLVAQRSTYRGALIIRSPEGPAIRTQEGVAALDEAIGALRRAPRRLPRLAVSEALTRAARTHARDLANSGLLGHAGSDGSSPDERVSRVGKWDGLVAENIAFGRMSAEEIVIGLLVDDGVPSRGHREVLLTRELFFAGVACGPHPIYQMTCVIDYATSFKGAR